MSLEELIRSATSRAGVVRVRNALNPLLWLCAVATPLCLCASYAFGSDPVLRYGFATLGAFPIIASLIAYFYFMVRQPDRLQSEEFLLREIELRTLERKKDVPVATDINTIEELSAPANPEGEQP